MTNITSYEKKVQRQLIPSYILIFIILAVIIIPLTLVIIMSGSDWSAFNKNFLSIFTTGVQWDNYVSAWVDGKMVMYLSNTLFVELVALFLINLLASLIGYAIKYYGNKLTSITYYIILSAMFIPSQALMYPLYHVMSNLGLLNSLVGLAVVYTGTSLPLATMLYAGFFRSVPTELIEAATIDGCGHFKIYYRIFIPISKTIISTVTILNGMTIWKDFFLPMVLISDANKKTIATSMQLFVSEFTTNWSSVCAAMVIQTLPIVVVFIALQKQFMEGMTAGAVKG